MHYETRRATYRPSLVDPVTGLDTMFSSFERESKQLVPVCIFQFSLLLFIVVHYFSNLSSNVVPPGGALFRSFLC